jgi:hypothetical protein
MARNFVGKSEYLKNDQRCLFLAGEYGMITIRRKEIAKETNRLR